MAQETLQRQWFARYYGALGSESNDPRTNLGARFQALAFEFSLVRALAHIGIGSARSTLLDVECGLAAGFYQYIRLGFAQPNITSIKVQASRIEGVRAAYRRRDLCMGTVRVRCPGGYPVLVDWRTPRPGESELPSAHAARGPAAPPCGRGNRIGCSQLRCAHPASRAVPVIPARGRPLSCCHVGAGYRWPSRLPVEETPGACRQMEHAHQGRIPRAFRNIRAISYRPFPNGDLKNVS